jgi:hypothetical protein
MSSPVLYGLAGSRNTLVCVVICCSLVMTSTSPALAKCNPNGTANEAIGCIDEGNDATKKQLARFYSRYLYTFNTQCQTQFPGGGSGGHSDRAMCLQDKLKAESGRVGLPNK